MQFVSSVLGSACLAVIVTLARPSTLVAEQYYSFVLDETAFANNPELSAEDPNTIFSAESTQISAVVASTRLADALNALGWSVRVDAFSYGHDIGGMNNHTYHVFGISLTSAGASRAVAKTPLWYEPTSEAESDFFQIKDRQVLTRIVSTHRKVFDDNSDSPVPPQGIDERPKSLGLTGTYGRPKGVAPSVSNVSGFDLNKHRAEYDIYFSIDTFASHASVASGASISPADILQLSTTGVISRWRTASFLGLDAANDNLDALSLNLGGWGLPTGTGTIGWYSVTRDSAALLTYGHAAADIFQFLPNGLGHDVPPIHIRCEAAGLWSRFFSAGSPDVDADIDSITTMDPEGFFPWRVLEVSDTVIEVTGGSPLATTYGVVTDGVPSVLDEASQLQQTISIEAGDYRLIEVDGFRGPYRALGDGTLTNVGVLESVSDITASVIGSTVTWSWQNPSPNPYDSIELTIDDQPPFDVPASSVSQVEFGLLAGLHSIRIRGMNISGASDAGYGKAFVEPAVGLDAVEELTVTAVGGGLFEVEWTNPSDFDSLQVDVNGQLEGSVGSVVAGQVSTVTVFLPEGRSVVTVRGFQFTGSSVPSAVIVNREPLHPGNALQVGGALPPVVDVAISPDGLVLVFDASGELQVYDPLDLTLPIGSVGPPAAGVVQGVTTNPSGLYWVIDGLLYQTDPLGLGAILLGLIDLPLGGVVGSLGFDGTTLWALDELNQVASSHDPATGAFTGQQVDALGDEIVGLDARFQQPAGHLELAHGTPGQIDNVSSFDLSGNGVLTTLRGLGDPIVAIAWGVHPTTGGAALLVAFAGGQLTMYSAVSDLPNVDGRNCHDFVGFATRVGDQPAQPIPDGTPVGVASFLTVVGVPGTVGDLDVTLRIDHEFVGELEAFLTSPAGTQVQIYAGEGGNQTRVDRVIDDTTDGTFNDGFGTRGPSVGNALASFDGDPISGVWTLTLIDAAAGNSGSLEEWELSICSESSSPTFERGDCNGDGGFNIADAIALLSFLFTPGGPPPSCSDSCDANDDGALDIGDAIEILNVLFGGSAVLPPPFAGCGEDPTIDGLGCAISTGACP